MLKIKPGLPYSITINPTYWQQNSRTSTTERCYTFLDRFNTLLEKHASEADGIYYQLYPDISQPLQVIGDKSPTGGGRMHLHGWIFFKDWHAVREFYMHTLPRIAHNSDGRGQSAAIDIDTISDISVWVAYCKKSINTIWPTDEYLTNIPDSLHDIIMDFTDPSLYQARASPTPTQRPRTR